jgi:lipopolysaccharide transport system ATP-binding protein
MKPLIEIKNISKKYKIRGQEAPYLTLRDAFSKSKNKRNKNEFWALDDICFDVFAGDSIGIIGKNGAGKSTLLKILSKITPPTKGEIILRGMTASLLEVGTGFHQELTGRENIMLNGSLLGLSKKEILQRFDEIIDFSGVEKFLETPIKHYSSGMQLRLAFAVAAHLDPEILIIDEVLAVGDSEFQKKSLGKMEEVTKSGRTVLFVSHNLAAVQNLCNKGVVLENGKVVYNGNQNTAIEHYLNSNLSLSESLKNRTDRMGEGEIKINKIELKNISGQLIDSVISGQNFEIHMHFESKNESTLNIIPSINISTTLGTPVFTHHSRLKGKKFNVAKKGIFVLKINNLPLTETNYILGYSLISNDKILDGISRVMNLTVGKGDFFGHGEIPPISHGIVLVDGDWRIE